VFIARDALGTLGPAEASAMVWEVQRLAAIDGAVADIVVVDVTELFAHAGGLSAFQLAASDVRAAAHRAQKQVIWVLAPRAEDGFVPALTVTALGLGNQPVILSSEPLMSVCYDATAPTPHRRFTIATAKFAPRRHDRWLIAVREVSVLDLATGRLWSRADFAQSTALEPFAQAVLDTATRHPPERYRSALLEFATPGSPDGRGRAPPPAWLLDEYLERTADARRKKKRAAADDRERRLLGWDRPDETARDALRAALGPVAPAAVTTGYVCADVARGLTRLSVDRVVCGMPDGTWHRASTAPAVRALLQQLHAALRDRWFGPRMIDLLAWMIRENLPLPARAIDPAWVAHILDPEAPLPLTHASPRLLGLDPDAIEWLGDLTRAAAAPTSLDRVARELPPLDNALATDASRVGVSLLVEQDFGRTLPVLARIEARGVVLSVPTGHADWSAVDAHLRASVQAAADAVTLKLGPVDWRDPVRLVKAIEKVVPWLPADEKECPVTDQIERYIAQQTQLAPLARLRALDTFIGRAPLWHHVRASAGSIHAQSFPEKNGRIGLRNPGLQSLNRRGPEGSLIRSSLVARSGHTLIGCDYNGFEARIVADLCGDPVLVQAAGSSDIFDALARRVLGRGSVTRDERNIVKLALLAIVYGQSRERFWIALPGVPRPSADALYSKLINALPRLFEFREQVYTAIASSGAPSVTTRGGWLRALRSARQERRQREGFNAVVQGLAADIFRRVLRELDRALPQHGAHVVHHAFDEVFVEAPTPNATIVASLIVSTMVSAGQGLLTNVALVVKQPKLGNTWADLI